MQRAESAWPDIAFLAACLVAGFSLDRLPVLAGIILLSGLPALAAGQRRAWLSVFGSAVILALPMLFISGLLSGEPGFVVWRGPVLPLLGRLRLTDGSIRLGLVQAARLIIGVSSFYGFGATVSRPALNEVTARLWPGLAVTATVSTNLLPVLAVDAGRLSQAQLSRGAPAAPAFKSLLSWRLPLLLRLSESALERGSNLAEALESRAFGSGRRRPALSRPLDGAGRAVILFSCLGSGIALAGILEPGMSQAVSLLPLAVAASCLVGSRS